MTSQTYTHPSPTINRILQIGVLLLIILILLTVPVQLYLAWMLRAPAFVLTSLLTVAMTLPLLMPITATPALSTDDDGLTLHPVIWPEQRIAWGAITERRDYPLLPSPDQETGRRLLVGRNKYQPAVGQMLVIPSLPLPYRVVGFFVFKRWVGSIAVTNRSHSDYDALIRTLDRHAPALSGHGEQA